jgi:cell division protein FtsQ
VSEAMVSRKRTDRRRSRSGGSLPGKIITIGAVMMSFGIVLYVIAVTVVVPRIRISRVIVQADFEMDRTRLLELAGLQEGAHYFSVNPVVVARQIESHPAIRSAEVIKTFPDTVTLQLDRRRPVAASLIESERATELVLIDETGTIFMNGQGAAGYDVPVISGITFRGRVVGSSLPETMKPLLESLYELRVSSPEIYGLISEIRIEAIRAGEYEVLLYTQGFQIPVRMSGTIDPRTCTYALMVLDVLAQQGISGEVKELDFRSGEIVYRMKEADHAGE